MEFKIPRRRRRRKHLLQSETRSFSISIAIIPTHLLCLMQANSSGVEFLRTISKFKAGEREKISSSFVHVYPKMWNLVISRRSRTAMTKKCAKECAARAELLFLHKIQLWALYSLPFTWYETAMLGGKSRTGARPTKGIHNFCLSQCDVCVPAWRFCIRRMASCKGPIAHETFLLTSTL